MIKILLSLSFGILIGAISFAIYFIYIFDVKQMVILKYVAQDELFTLEKNRIRSQNLDNTNIFFSKPDRAVELTVQLAFANENNRTKVLLTESTIIGDNVESISAKIHKEVIERLEHEDSQ